MGTYIPTDAPRTRSVQDTLAEAEEDHYLDCPDADFFIRAAALLLDIIFCFLITSAIRRIAGVAAGYLPGAPLFPGAPTPAVIRQLSLGVRVLALYLYLVWSVPTFGGTPAKLLLGLRVIDARTGRPLSLPRTLAREAIGKLLSAAPCALGFFLSIFRKDHRALHDLLSGSVVKRTHGEP